MLVKGCALYACLSCKAHAWRRWPRRRQMVRPPCWPGDRAGGTGRSSNRFSSGFRAGLDTQDLNSGHCCNQACRCRDLTTRPNYHAIAPTGWDLYCGERSSRAATTAVVKVAMACVSGSGREVMVATTVSAESADGLYGTRTVISAIVLGQEWQSSKDCHSSPAPWIERNLPGAAATLRARASHLGDGLGHDIKGVEIDKAVA